MGTCEHFNIPVKSIDILTGNLAAVTSSVGGFCCASKPIVYHQRLNSTGYVYSASLPPILAAVSIAALNILDENPELLSQLHKSIEILYRGLSNIEGVVLNGSPITAVMHLRLAKSTGDRYEDEAILQQIVEEALAGDVLLTRAKYVHEKESFPPPPSIRITASSINTKEQLNDAIAIIKNAVKNALKGTGKLRTGE